MIDPSNITNFNLIDAELEEHILFWVAAAGKNGRTAARCLEKFMITTAAKYQNNAPFAAILKTKSLFDLPETLKSCGMGCYNNKARSFYELAVAKFSDKLNLRTCSAEDLEKIYGIGMKTARCFILHSRKGARLSGLDTHMLKHLREMGVEDVPKSTPSSKKKYMILEQEVLKLADEAGMSPADYDLMIWNKYSIKTKEKENYEKKI